MTDLQEPTSAVDRWTTHSPYSDPGVHADLLRALDPSTHTLSAVARNVIAHYRGEADALPASTRADIHLRWLADQLATDQDRHHTPLTTPRALPERLQGCCRDHSLFCVGALREHGLPARTRIGFAGYFAPGFHHDHVVVERLDGDRWVRFDPELTAGGPEGFDVTDMPTGPASPFQTAAEVWQRYRDGSLDVTRYGVDPSLGEPLRGAPIVAAYVIGEVAHRHGDELLLWDMWGQRAQDPLADLSLIDDVAALLVAADEEERAGDLDGPRARELAARYADDDRLHPGAEVARLSPLQPGVPPVRVALR